MSVTTRLLALLCFFPCLLSAQRDRSYRLDIADAEVDLSGLSFNVTEVVDETGVKDDIFGMVYTGLLNTQRPLTLRGGLTINLRTSLLRSIADRQRPQATLLIRYLRIDEEITFTSEHRRLQLTAALRMTDPSGRVRYFGPRQYTDVRGGLDVTGGHAQALVTALEHVLTLLNLDYRADRASGTPGLVEVDPLPEGLADGAYYSLADFRAGRVDTTTRLLFKNKTYADRFGGVSLYVARFDPPASISRREARELWGYHHAGHSYLSLQNKYYEISPDGKGRFLVSIPGGLTDVAQLTRRAAFGGVLFGAIGGLAASSDSGSSTSSRFELDMTSGTLLPITGEGEAPAGASRHDPADRILLYYPGSSNGELYVTIDGGQVRIPEGTYVSTYGSTKIVLRTAPTGGKPYYRKITPDPKTGVSLYYVGITKGGKITLRHADHTAARNTADAIAEGQLLAAEN